MLHNYFDKTYLINLDKREDRLEQSYKVCEEIGLVFERYRAIPGDEVVSFTQYDVAYMEEIRWNNCAAGLVQTTINIITEAQKNKYKSILILEDDIEFNPIISKVIHNYMDSLTFDWDLFYFGATHVEPVQIVNRYIARVKNANSCHCYAIHENAYQQILDILSPVEIPLDYALRLKIHPKGKSYCVYPNMAYQFSGVSDIAGKYYNTSFIKQY